VKQIAWYMAIVLFTITALVLIWQLRQAVILFLISLATAATLRPAIEFLTQRKIPRGIALFLIYGSLVGLMVGLVLAVSGPLIRDLERASNQFALGYERIMSSWPESGTRFQQILAERLPPPEDLYTGNANGEGSGIVESMIGLTTNALSLFGKLGMVLILSLYWSADSVRFERLMLSLTSVEKRDQARLIWRGIDAGVGAYIRSELVQSFLAGILLWVGYRMIGLEFPVLLALMGALAWLIPWFGALFAMIPAFLVGLSMGGLSLGVLAALYTLMVLVVQEWIIEPRIFRRQAYSSVILVLVVLAMADLFGLIGLILAPMVSAAIQIVGKYLLQPPTASVLARQTVERVEEVNDNLQLRLEQTREIIEGREEPAPPELVNLMDRLDKLVSEANPYLN
jgi:predicted PurR-regulated permease PerM